jgi:hypothetical protein
MEVNDVDRFSALPQAYVLNRDRTSFRADFNMFSNAAHERCT